MLNITCAVVLVVLLRISPKRHELEEDNVRKKLEAGSLEGIHRIAGLMTAGFLRRKPCNGAVSPGAALFLAPGDSNSFNPVYVLYGGKAPSIYIFLGFEVHYLRLGELLNAYIDCNIYFYSEPRQESYCK